MFSGPLSFRAIKDGNSLSKGPNHCSAFITNNGRLFNIHQHEALNHRAIIFIHSENVVTIGKATIYSPYLIALELNSLLDHFTWYLRVKCIVLGLQSNAAHQLRTNCFLPRRTFINQTASLNDNLIVSQSTLVIRYQFRFVTKKEMNSYVATEGLEFLQIDRQSRTYLLAKQYVTVVTQEKRWPVIKIFHVFASLNSSNMKDG